MQIAIDSIYTVKIASFFLLFILLIANSGNYLHLSIVVHYKTVRNNNVLRVNYRLIQIIKWMPPMGQQSPPYTYLTLPDTFIFNFLIISFIVIENKCLSDAI